MKDKNVKIKTAYLFFVVGVISITIGISVAFFNYTRTGGTNTVRTGRIYFNSTQNGNISLTNVFPIASDKLATDVGNHDTVTINIIGDTEYTEGIEYLVSFTDVNNMINNKKIPISYTITTNNLGTDDEDDYWNDRGSDDSLYIIMNNGVTNEDGQILAGFIAAGAEGISGSITITAYIDSDTIAITDTPEENIEWINGRTDITTSEWNSLQTTGVSFKIKVEANEGIWVEGPTPGDCFITSQNDNDTLSIDGYVEDVITYTYNTQMTEEELEDCEQNIESYVSGSGGSPKNSIPELKYKVQFLSSYRPKKIATWQTGETKEAFCRGTGTFDGKTFQEYIDNNLFTNINNMVQNNFIAENVVERPSYCNTSDIIIPRKIGNILVTTIGNSAFNGDELTSVTIPNSVTTIRQDAFRYNQLTSVTIPNSVTTIGNGAFANNQLTSVTIPNSITTIGQDVFLSNQLTSVIIPNSVEIIGQDAFRNNQLTSVIIPNSVETIENGAFQNNQLTSVTIPNSITTIGNGVFGANFYLTSMKIDMPNIPNNFLSNQSITSLTNLIIGEHVTTIGNYAFQNNQLSNITISNGVEIIGNYAFQNNQLSNVTIPNSVETIGKSAFRYNQLTSVMIPNSVETIGQEAFRNNQLTSVIIPNSVTEVGSYAFYNNEIKSLTIDMTTIPNGEMDTSFAASIGLSNLENLTIGNNVITIGQLAFKSNAITNLSLGNNVVTIGNGAFRNNQLTSVIIPNSVKTIEEQAFYGNQLTSIVIPNSVTTIGIDAFSYNQLASVTIGNGITSIGAKAFEKYNPQNSEMSKSNPNLASITIDKSCSVIKSMTDYAWIGLSAYRSGTTIYGSNNEVCDSW